MAKKLDEQIEQLKLALDIRGEAKAIVEEERDKAEQALTQRDEELRARVRELEPLMRREIGSRGWTIFRAHFDPIFEGGNND